MSLIVTTVNKQTLWYSLVHIGFLGLEGGSFFEAECLLVQGGRLFKIGHLITWMWYDWFIIVHAAQQQGGRLFKIGHLIK